MSGKRLIDIKKSVDRKKAYSVAEAINTLKAHSKLGESVDIAMNLNIEASKTDQSLRGSTSLPHGIGRTCRVAVVARGDKAKEAADAGADVVGAEELIESIKKGEINFDACVATPDMMGLLGQVACVLGPRGLMPNPKLGTVTLDVKGVVNSLKAGRVNYKNDKGGVVHAIVGKVSFDEKDLVENVEAFIDHINAARPSGVRGKFVKSIYLSTTQGVSLMLQA